MLAFNKDTIRDMITLSDIFDLLQEWGGDPIYTSFGIISATICHNKPGDGSRKLYFYENSGLFRCYTGCEEPNFDIFELVRKIADIQWNKNYDLNDAIRWIASRLGLSDTYVHDEKESLEDWKILANYERIQEIEVKISNVVLKEYDDTILSRFNYNVIIEPWLQDNISIEAMKDANIGYYPGGEQITIPHYDENNRFIGLRGRSLIKEEAEMFGKYRPLKINKELYNHPLGMNLYNLNRSKKNIKIMKTAIVFESEKSTLQYKTYFGLENDISVACCGSSVSAYQIQLLIDAGAEEIVIAFDRQFQDIGDNEFKKLKANLMKLYSKYKNYVNISFIFDKHKITDYKSSPTDHGKEIFLKLFNERIVL